MIQSFQLKLILTIRFFVFSKIVKSDFSRDKNKMWLFIRCDYWILAKIKDKNDFSFHICNILKYFFTRIDIYRSICYKPEAEFKDFELRLIFETRLKSGCFHLKWYLMFQDLSRRSIETGFRWIWDAAKIL